MDTTLLRTFGVTAESYEAGIEHLRQFAITDHGTSYCYALLMEEEDGTYKIVERVGMPCWGALREYKTGTRPNDRWPYDLQTEYHIFPKTGKVAAVAACFARGQVLESTNKYQTTGEDWNTFIEFVFNPEISPWKKALTGFELQKNKDGIYWGVVFTDTKIDPNIMLSLLRGNVLNLLKATNFCAFLKNNPGIDPRIAWLKAAMPGPYYFSPRVILKDFFTGDPTTVPMEGTFYERTSYNRPDIEFIFGGKNNTGVVASQLSIEQLQQELANATGVA